MLIKQGAQYRVYPYWGRRVKKVPHSLRRAVAIFRGWSKGEMSDAEIRSHAFESVENGRRAVRALAELCAEHPSVYRYLCQPKFSARGSYSQRRVTMLGKVFAKGDHASNVRLIREYAEALLEEWKYGFCESEFNLTLNNGLDADGNIVLVDLGDIVFEKAEVARLIKQQPWLSGWSYTKGLPEDLRAPFARIMQETLTPANLDKNWRAALHDARRSVKTAETPE